MRSCRDLWLPIAFVELLGTTQFPKKEHPSEGWPGPSAGRLDFRCVKPRRLFTIYFRRAVHKVFEGWHRRNVSK
jgi:hypothetical protein